MDINIDIFECAATSLNNVELRVILEEHKVPFSIKDKKHEIIAKLIGLIKANNMSEELYLAINTKAFSENDDSNEGFFYRYIGDNIDFNFDKFMHLLYKEMDNNTKSKYGTSTFKYNAYSVEHDELKKKIKFIFSKETTTKKYDRIDEIAKIFNELIKVNIEVSYNENLVYIQSKNYNNSSAVKFFLEKVINNLRIDKTEPKVRLTMPKFDGQIVSKWASENKVDIKGISSTTIHMLDFLSEFEDEDNNFAGYEMNKIYFGNEIVDNKQKNRLKGSIHYGDDIKECIEVSEGIINGKKINGFEISVHYLHLDEDSGTDIEVVQVPVTVLQEDNNTIRLAISKEINTIDKLILLDIYENVRNVYLKKLKSNKINNTDEIVGFINRAKEIFKKEGVQAELKESKAVII